MYTSKSMQWQDLEQFQATHSLALRRVGVAVSGGKDSMVLWHLACQWAQQCQVTLVAIHVNHHLRADDSEADQALIQNVCSQEADAVVCVDGALGEHSDESIEMAARRIRYEAFAEVVNTHALDGVMLAHHAHDQAETLIMRMGQGTGLTGLQGMLPCRKHNDQFYVMRPLLSCARRDIDAYADDHGVCWRDDVSNASDKFMRNRVRHQVVPVLEREVNTETVQHLTHLASDAQEAMAYFEKQVDDLWHDVCVGGELVCDTLQVLDPLIRRLVLQRFIVRETVVNRLTRERLLALDALLCNSSGLKQLDLGDGEVMMRSGGGLMVKRTVREDRVESLALPDSGVISWNGVTWRVDCTPCPDTCGPDMMVLSADYKAFSLLLRTREPEDFVVFNDAGQHKRLQDLFVDAKIPAHRRDRWPLLALEKRILWVPGVFRDKSCRPQKHDCTSACLVLQCEERK